MEWPLQFGLFLAPLHHPQQNPTRALRRDLELIVRAEELGYTEAWIGEHYSTGHEIIAGGDLFVAAAAERTKRIRLGTGATSLPFHHPFVVASRAVQLDHMTMGRYVLGVGPGSLPTDSTMMGLDHLQQRRMMAESFEAIHALLTSDEPVTRSTDWFTLNEAELQLKPFSYPLFEMAVAAVESPAGPMLAGRYGASLLSLAAASGPGFLAMPRMWGVLEDTAKEFGRTADRRIVAGDRLDACRQLLRAGGGGRPPRPAPVHGLHEPGDGQSGGRSHGDREAGSADALRSRSSSKGSTPASPAAWGAPKRRSPSFSGWWTTPRGVSGPSCS